MGIAILACGSTVGSGDVSCCVKGSLTAAGFCSLERGVDAIDIARSTFCQLANT